MRMPLGCVVGERTLALISLFADAPDEFFAVCAECGLPQEERHEFMARDFVDLPPHRTSSLSGERTGALLEYPLRFTRILCRF